MRLLNAATRRLINAATTAHIKSLGLTVSLHDRKLATAMWNTDAAQVATYAAERALRNATDVEANVLRDNIATRAAANAEIAGLRRGVTV